MIHYTAKFVQILNKFNVNNNAARVQYVNILTLYVFKLTARTYAYADVIQPEKYKISNNTFPARSIKPDGPATAGVPQSGAG